MKVGALIFGIIGGLIALLYGIVGYGFGGLAHSSGLAIISIVIPIVALVGAGMVMQMPAIGALLMALAAVGFIFVLGFNIITLIPVVLLAIAAILGFMDLLQERTRQRA
jgi:hypothetical protein